MLGSSPSLEAVRRAIAQVAPTDASVMILGETGTGKELVAREIHQQSHRHDRSFVPVNCVALAPGLVASELFGHEAGAFTGAIKQRAGRFELADEGTLFLDELGEMPGEVQSMLLRAIQERVVEPVGGQSLSVDVRLISATNRDLAGEVKAGSFRADLFYRLSVFPIRLPPLRERRTDIAELAEHFLRLFAERHGKIVERFRPGTLTMLTAHDWPGNIRELQNAIERAVIVSEGEVLEFDPSWLVGMSVAETAKTWAEEEKQRIVDALQASAGRVYGPGGAAHRLGLKPTTLYGKMRKHGINRQGVEWR